MSNIDFNSTTFSSRLTELNTALQKKDKWINDGLEVVNKENGFVRFIKIIVLPLARLFGADPFTHVRANAVALVIFAEFQKHEGQLSAEDKKTTYQILDRLNARTKNKYDIILMVFMPSVNKAFDRNIGTTPSKYIDLGVKGTQQVGSSIPLPPPNDGYKQYIEDQKQKTKEALASLNIKETKEDLLQDVFGKESKVKSSDAEVIVKQFNSPIAGTGLSRLRSEIGAFVDTLNRTDKEDSEINVKGEDLLFCVENHAILGKFYNEFATLPTEKKGKWIAKTIEYLEDDLLESLAAVTKKNAPKPKTAEAQQLFQQQQAHMAQVKKQEELEKILAKKENLRKEMNVDLSTTQGKNKFSWNMTLAKYKPLHENPEDKYKFTHRDYVAEYQRVLTWINTGDLSDENMLARHDILTKIAQDWKNIIN